MSEEELQQMADQAQAEEAAEDKAQHEAEIEVLTEEPTVAVDTQGLQMIAVKGVGAIGGIGCRMAHVTPLEGGEVEALADCLVGLAEVYDLGNMSPKVAAWFNLGAVSVAVFASREKLPPVEPANDDQADEESADPPPPQGYGDGETPSPPPPSRKRPAAKKPKGKGAKGGKTPKAR